MIKCLAISFLLALVAVSPAPAATPVRRLNRYEYNCTIRDLLGVDFDAAGNLPADNFSYGFDNNAATLSVTPALLAKYLDAAKKIARAAVESVPAPATPQLERHGNTSHTTDFTWTRKFLWGGEYDLHIAIAGRVDPFALTLAVDDGAPQRLNLSFDFEGRRFANTRSYFSRGSHRLRISTVRDDDRAVDGALAYEVVKARKSGSQPLSRDEIRFGLMAGTLADSKGEVTPPYAEYVEARGPHGMVLPALPPGYALVFSCGHAPGQHTPACARSNLETLARRAWRRPVTAAEMRHLLQLAGGAQDLQQQMETGIEAILVSPSFLFRLESGDFELASRLSYFLWSSLPDEELFHAAEQHRLADPAVLEAQTRRMLASPKADALAENFAAQWLAFRNLDSLHRDPARFPQFTPELRDSMRRETELFVEHIVHEDRSILDFLTGKYTFVDESLAKLYGIPGVVGDTFRQVDLAGTPRSGVLTQASVLAVTSYSTRTSPVLRGKWILENILNDPPPPPPANVAALRDSSSDTATLRQQLEQHRSDPACAGCHARIDPLGFGLENFDAIGRWRTHDEALEIDATGTLPDGSRFSSAAELAAILAKHPEAFARSLTEKLITFALGRGLDSADRTAAAAIVKSAAGNNFRFSDLIVGVVDSEPFRASGVAHE